MNATSGTASGVARLVIVSQNTRHPTTHSTASKLVSRATVRKMRQNLWWAAGYNILAFPIAAGVFYPAFGILLSPWIAALSMSGSSLLVALNALLLKWTKLPGIRRMEAKPVRTAPAGPLGTPVVAHEGHGG